MWAREADFYKENIEDLQITHQQMIYITLL